MDLSSYRWQIGYGTFAPRTMGGRFLTLVWGVVGIGLFGGCLGVLGGLIDELLNWLTRSLKTSEEDDEDDDDRLSKLSLSRANPKQLRRKTIITIVSVVLVWLTSAFVFRGLMSAHGEEWTLGESIYYAGITFLTIGLGDFSVNWSGSTDWLAVIFFIVLTTVGLILFAVLISIALTVVKSTAVQVVLMEHQLKEELEEMTQGAMHVARKASVQIVGEDGVLSANSWRRKQSLLRRAANKGLAFGSSLGSGRQRSHSVPTAAALRKQEIATGQPAGNSTPKKSSTIRLAGGDESNDDKCAADSASSTSSRAGRTSARAQPDRQRQHMGRTRGGDNANPAAVAEPRRKAGVTRAATSRYSQRTAATKMQACERGRQARGRASSKPRGGSYAPPGVLGRAAGDIYSKETSFSKESPRESAKMRAAAAIRMQARERGRQARSGDSRARMPGALGRVGADLF
jgi:hypothetical protein